jgi:phosphate acyltransferase
LIDIALDVLGGDLPPEIRLKGAIEALQEDNNLTLSLVGKRDLINSFLENNSAKSFLKRINIVNADDIIEMNESPTKVLKEKKVSSIAITTKLVKEGYSKGLVSAGNTGAQMATAIFQFGRIGSIDRPGIAITVPTEKGPIILIDGGANVDVKPKNILEFGIMGYVFAKTAYNIKDPKIALINNGTEEEKGNKVTKESFSLLKDNLKSFIGYIEGREMMKGKADVVVCDGFIGNIILKVIEGVGLSILSILKNDIKQNFTKKFGAMFLKNTFKNLKNKMDYREYGGAPLLGVKGITIISHGSSDNLAIKNAIKLAVKMYKEDTINLIEKELIETNFV